MAAQTSPAHSASQAVAPAIGLLGLFYPQYVLVAGGIVYPRGRAAEYRKVFYPVYNLEAVPLLRSTPVLSVPGKAPNAA